MFASCQRVLERSPATLPAASWVNSDSTWSRMMSRSVHTLAPLSRSLSPVRDREIVLPVHIVSAKLRLAHDRIAAVLESPGESL